MRASVILGLVLLAGLGGYAVSRLQGPPAAAKIDAGQSTAGTPETPATAGTGTRSTDDKPTTEAGARASFVADVPNTATMSATPTLPPESLPLTQSAAQLTELMRSGSREATLRLLRQTEQCDLYRKGRQGLDMALGLSEAAQNPQAQEGSVAILFNGKAGEKSQLESMTEGAAELMAKHELQCAGFTDPDDRRIARLSITPKGVEVSEYVENLFVRELRRSTDAFSTTQVKDLSHWIEVLRGIREDIGSHLNLDPHDPLRAIVRAGNQDEDDE